MDSTPASSTEKRHVRSAKNYLIEPGFQLKWVLRVAFTVLLITSVMGVFLYRTLSEIIDVVSVQTLGVGTLTEQAQQLIIQQGRHDKTFTLIVLLISLVVLVTVLSMLTIVVTHKVAGPIYKIKKLLASIDDSNLQLMARLRKGDELRDVFDEFDHMLARLQEGRSKDIKTLTMIIEQLNKADSHLDETAQLEQIITRYRNSINTDNDN